MKNNNTILWVIGILVFFLVVTNLPLPGFPFAIVSKTVCSEGINNYYSFDGNFLDLRGNQNVINNGTIFIGGRLGSGALEFDGTTSISFPVLPINLSTGFWINNYSNQNGWTYLIYGNTSILSDNFMLGLNGSIDEIVIGTNISGFSDIQPCYTTTEEVNVTCFDYASSQISDNLTGSLSVTGDFYPACDFTWKSIQYEIKNNQCEKSFFYESSCLEPNCYSTNQACIEDLDYECYILQNNICSKKTDYNTCIVKTDYYSNLTGCQEDIIPSTTGTSSTVTTEVTLKDKLNKEIADIGGFQIKLIHLIILLIIVGGILFLRRK